MKLIVITQPHFFVGEAEVLNALFHAGLEVLHLRKPEASAHEMAQLLDAIAAEYHPRIVVHDRFELTDRYRLKGIHLNRRNPQPPDGYQGSISASCHSLSEASQRKAAYSYIFLSPIYNSISKNGYNSTFTRQELEQARDGGIIDRRVIALGGINNDHLGEIRRLGFGGAAVLGDLWNHPYEDIMPHFQRLRQSVRCPVVLSIAGSDSSAGAGLQADLKTVSALGGYAATVITAVTSQNTQGVQSVHPLPTEVVSQQIKSVVSDLHPDAVKIGMVPTADIACAIADSLRHHPMRHVVCDPVMVSTSGRQLMDNDCLQILRTQLFPLCTLLTPNLSEASLLAGETLTTIDDMKRAARLLSQRYGTAVLVKGGHLPGQQMCDVLFDGELISLHSLQKVDSPNLHGTGCTLSSAIATFLTYGFPLQEAVTLAKNYVHQAIQQGRFLSIGQGNGPLEHRVDGLHLA